MEQKINFHNLRDEPQVYVSNKTVNDFLQKHGADALPITLVDGEIAVSQTYPRIRRLAVVLSVRIIKSSLWDIMDFR